MEVQISTQRLIAFAVINTTSQEHPFGAINFDSFHPSLACRTLVLDFQGFVQTEVTEEMATGRSHHPFQGRETLESFHADRAVQSGLQELGFIACSGVGGGGSGLFQCWRRKSVFAPNRVTPISLRIIPPISCQVLLPLQVVPPISCPLLRSNTSECFVISCPWLRRNLSEHFIIRLPMPTSPSHLAVVRLGMGIPGFCKGVGHKVWRGGGFLMCPWARKVLLGPTCILKRA